jgi:tetratricopeptide (TPR) repeat protein
LQEVYRGEADKEQKILDQVMAGKTGSVGVGEKEDGVVLGEENVDALLEEAKAALGRAEYSQALEKFTTAIAAAETQRRTDEVLSRLFHGRSTVFTKMQLYEDALRDSDRALSLNEALY